MRVIPLAFLFSLFAAVATAELPDQLDIVLEKHRAAVTDDPTMGPVRSIQVDVLIEEPEFTLTATYLANREGEMRIDVYDGETRVFSEGLGSNGGWQWFGDAVAIEPVTAAGQAALERGVVANLYDLHERPALGYKLSYEGLAEKDGVVYWKILSRAPDGFEELYFINRETGLIDRKFEVSALHPDMDSRERPAMTYMSDYRARGGRYFAFRTEKRAMDTGELLQTTTISDLRVNAGIDELKVPLSSN